MTAAFKVQGELVLGNSGFVASATEAKTAVQAVDQAGQKLSTTARELASSSDAAAAAASKQAATTTALGQAQTTAAAAGATHGTTITGVARAATAAEVSTRTLRAANDDLGKSIDVVGGKLNTFQKTQLGFQLNDVFTQLASGQGIIRTAVQQGPQITQIFGGVGATLARIPPVAVAAVAAIAAVAGVYYATVGRGAELVAMNRQAESSLVATGRAAMVTADQFQQLVIAESARPGAGRDQTQQAALQLLGNNALSGQAIQQTLGLARDLARITGTDLPTAAAALSSGLDGTVAGAQKLDATFNVLTPAELEQIRNFQAMGDKGGAVSVMLNALQRNLAGANERGIGPLKQGFNDLGTALDRVLDKIASPKAANFLQNLAAVPAVAIANAINNVTGPAAAPGGAPSGQELEQLRQQAAAARQQLEIMKSDAVQRQANSPGDTVAISRQIVQQIATVKDIEARLRDAEEKFAASSATSVSAQVQGQGAQLRRDISDASALADKYATVVAQRQQLQAERTRLQSVVDSPIADPQQIARASEAITQIDGKLRALRTPADEARRALDFEGEMAKLPPHIQAAERAAEETKRKFLEMGQSEAQAEAAADKARQNVLQTQATATGQQIQLLSDEATAALRVAAAYGTSRAAALQLQAQLKAQSAEQQGSIAPGTAGQVAQMTLEENAGNAIAAAAEKNEAYAREVAGLNRLVAAEGQGAAAAREAERVNKVAAMAEDLRAQAAATGSATIIAAAERQIASYDKLTKAELAANVQRDAQALNRQYDPNSAYDYDISRLKELQSTGLLTARTVAEAFKDADLRRLQSSRQATDGLIGGLRQYADEATNAGRAASDGVQSFGRSIEDFGVTAITTMKFSFTDLANSIIADLARIAIRQTITGPLATGLSGVLANVFGSGGGGPTTGPGTGYTYHQGGLVGRDGGEARTLPGWVWAGAPRFHGGGIPGLGPNERPIIALDDEEVLKRNDPRHRWNLGGRSGASSAPQISINIVKNGDPVSATQGAVTPNGSGGFNVELILDRVDEGMAKRADNGTGKFMGVLQGRYNVKRTPRR